jgi:hypothetical protein
MGLLRLRLLAIGKSLVPMQLLTLSSQAFLGGREL